MTRESRKYKKSFKFCRTLQITQSNNTKNDKVEYLARRKEEDKCTEFQLQNFVEGITLNI